MTSAGAARVLRLAATGRPRHDRSPELVRLFGRDVEVILLVRASSPTEVAGTAVDEGVQAVVVESFRGDIEELRRCVEPVTVLRPMFERRPGAHAGPPTEQFAGYGRLLGSGEVLALADGALAGPVGG